MGLPGGPELLIILVIVMLVFSASRLPKLARSIGQAGKEFKTGMKEGYTESEEDEKEEAPRRRRLPRSA
ncbi:MAG: Sec-independent protein translocase subunit TatA/TatB [Actinomycetota bacterium]